MTLFWTPSQYGLAEPFISPEEPTVPLPPPRDHRIPLSTAVAMTRRYRASVTPGSFRAGLFPSKVFEDLLAQKGCAAIRIYLGCHEDNALNLVMVAVDAEGRDIVPIGDGLYEEGEVIQDGVCCPPFCDKGSPLDEG